ncbi:MAG: redoxin domain-containing protein [Chloroflexi bacterium]|nr:redoxin domain-containing protein [Chloroflexota bacterium]MCI0814633.1 redoxin domain-containing protein [Chloroflexota bacterium]MCI0817470.1 redoxin domain-containing protein [Chloroflexota bacterium]MCI0819171.1 redoxin domain-containing protein [Chloroflexota bacterium]MCI0832732.1 redoxin domain-containing protein [Chloroflexota bacterium]
MPTPGDPAPRFTLPTTAGELSLDDLTARGKLVLAFYAEDATPLCSSQLSMLKDDYDAVRELGASVLALSADSLDSHRQFAQRLGGLPFPLASDEDLAVARLYNVADEEAKRSRRAAFVIDEKGVITHAEPWFQPGNSAQFEAIFRALGLEM